MAIPEAGSELPNLKIEIENDLDEAMDTDDNDNAIEDITSKDEGPEEGELSDSKDNDAVVKGSAYGLNTMTSNEPIWDREKRYENKGGAFVTGVDIFAKEEQSKLDERAKRFGIDPSAAKPVTEHQITELYKSMAVKDEEGQEKHFRLNAIHVRGTENMSTQDIFNYFKDYGPASIEWINDYSCNVIWLDNLSAARAMIGLSKHIKGLEDFHSKADPFLKEEEKEKGSDKENEKDEVVVVQEIEDDAEGVDVIMVVEKNDLAVAGEKNVVEIDSEMNIDNDEVLVSDIKIPIPPGKWRIGTSHPKAKCILLRFATRTDKKQPQAERMSEYYKKYGNPNYGGIKGIITQSRKRRYYRQDLPAKVFEDDQGDETDFSEAPMDGKNPWGNLAKSWSKLDQNRDRRRPDIQEPESSPPPSRTVPSMLLHADEEQGKSVLLRIGSVASSSAQNSENSSTSADSDDEPDWTKRSKIPRMKMYADEEENRIERRKAQVQAQTVRKSRNYRERESRSVDRERRHRRRRRRSNSGHRESTRSHHRSRENNRRKSRTDDSFERDTRNKDDLRSRLDKDTKVRGSVSVVASTVWDRLNQQHTDDVKEWEKETSESASDENVDNQDNYADLRDSVLQGKKSQARFDGGDLRSKLNLKKTMRQSVPVQKSPLRIEIDNDEYYRLIGSDQE